MNRKLFVIIQVVVCIFVASSIAASASPAPGTHNTAPAPAPAKGTSMSGGRTTPTSPNADEGPSFTYQGQLRDANGPVNGTRMMTLTLPQPLASTLTVVAGSARLVRFPMVVTGLGLAEVRARLTVQTLISMASALACSGQRAYWVILLFLGFEALVRSAVPELSAVP